MKTVRIHAYGAPEVLTYEDAPCPTPAEGEVHGANAEYAFILV